MHICILSPKEYSQMLIHRNGFPFPFLMATPGNTAHMYPSTCLRMYM